MNLKDYLQERGYTRIKLKMLKSNHFEMKVTVNGKKGRFILDTGASNSCIDQDRQEDFLMEVQETDVKVTGAGATEMDSRISSENSLKIGKFKLKKTAIVLFNLTHVNSGLASMDVDPIDGIIGTDILKKAKAVIDYDKKNLYLKLSK